MRKKKQLTTKMNNKGITLVALIITIVLLLILATISIGTAIQSGLIEKTEVVKDESVLLQYQESIKMITLEKYTEKVISGSSENLKKMVQERVLEEDWAKSAEDVPDNDNQIKVTTKDNHVIIAEIDDFGNVTINPDNDKEPIPSIEVAYNGKSGEKYQIKASATVEKTEKTSGVTTLELDGKNQVIKNYEDGKEVIFEVDETGVYWVKATTNYGKSAKKSIEIKDDESTEVNFDVTIDRDSFVYDGTAKEPAVTVKDGEKVLVKGTDYTVIYKNNVNVGTGEVTVTGKGKYSGKTETKTFTIIKAEVEIPTSPNDKTYNGEEQASGIKIPANANIVTAKSTVKATNVGTYTVEYSLNDIKNYEWKDKTTGNKSVKWKINAYDINNGTIENIETQKYNGKEQKPEITVIVPIPRGKTTTLIKDTDYTVKYSNNTSVGTGKVTIVGKVNYTGTKEATFEIIGKDINEDSNIRVTLEETSYTYDGTEKKPKVTVKDGETVLVENTNYTVEYSNNINAGTGKVTIIGKGNYSGKIEKTFTINKVSLTIPAQNGTLTYNKAEQSPSWSNYNTNIMTIGGTTKGTNAGSYNATFTLKNTTNYQWSDKTTEAKTVAWKIDQANGYVTLDANKSVTYGTASTTFAVKTNHGGTISVSDDNSTATSAINGTTVTVSNLSTLTAGTTVKITVNVATTTNYKAASAVFTLTIGKAGNPITVTNKTIYTGSTLDLSTVVSKAQGTLTYKIKTNGTTTASTLSGSKLTAGAMHAGVDDNQTVVVTVTAGGNTNYNSGSKDVTITVQKYTPTLAWTDTTPSSIVYGTTGKAATVTATVSGGTKGAIRYSSGTTSVLTIDESTGALTTKGGGSSVITARIAPTTTVKTGSTTKTISVTKATNPIAVTANTLTYNGKAQNLVTTKNAQGAVYYSVGTELASSNYKTAGSTTVPTQTAANTSGYVVYYYCEGNGSYNAKSGNVTVKINKANATNPTLTKVTAQYDGNAHAVTVSGGSGGTIYYRTSTDNTTWGDWTTTKPSRTDVGTTYVQAYVKGDANHNNTSATTSVTIVINKNTLTIKHYLENANDTNYTLVATTTNTTLKNGQSITLANYKKTDIANGKTYKQGSTTEGGTAVTTATMGANTIIYLYYIRDTYVLTLNKGSNISAVTGAGTYKVGQSVKIDATLAANATGYTNSWVNWTSSNTSLVANTTTKNATIKMPAAAITLTANGKATAKTVKVTFMRNLDSSDTTSDVQTFTYGVSGQKFSAKGWSKTGYTLLGWSHEKDATIKTYDVESGVTDNWKNRYSPAVTLYAVWEENITYYGQGQDMYSASEGKINVSHTTIYANIKKGNYTVTATADGSGVVSYTPKGGEKTTLITSNKGSPASNTVNITEEGELILSGSTCSVEIKLEDGSLAPLKYVGYTISYSPAIRPADMIKPGDTHTVSSYQGTPNGYGWKYIGYSEDKNATTATYQPKDVITPTSSMTLYAVKQYDDPVAKIGDKEYVTIEEAFNSAKNGETIELIRNVNQNPGSSQGTGAVVEGGKSITLNLNSFSFKGKRTTIQVKDTSSLNITGTGEIYSYTSRNIENSSTGIVQINEGVTLSSSPGGAISNTSTGTIIINGASINYASSSSGPATIDNSGNGLIWVKEKSTVTNITDNNVAISNTSGTVRIGTDDGTVNSNSPKITGGAYAISGSGNFEFYDGILSGTTNAIATGTTVKVPTGYAIATTTSNNVQSAILKKNATMTVSNASMIVQDGSSTTFTYTYDGDGAVTVKSSDTSIATCSVNTSTKTVTVNALKTSTKAATITVSAAAGTNYNATSKNVQVGAIVIGGIPTSWTKDDVKLTATTTLTGHRLQMMGESGIWQTTSSQTFTKNGTLSVRVLNSSLASVGTKSVTITKIDKTAPTFTSAEVKNVSASGYDVYIYGVADVGSGVNRVQFPTWTTNNGQDDIIWGSGTNQGNGIWYYRVNISDHNYEIGSYNTHIYMYDNVENATTTVVSIQNISGYTITYNANGGSGAPASQTKAYGKNITLSSTVPTKSGYTFLGWSTSNTATTATYAKGATYTDNKSVTLYAVWKISNVAPTTPTTSVTSRNTNTIIVNAKSTDSNGDKLIYKLYTKSASASGYTLSATSASTASGTAVNLTASSLSSYTVYNYYVTVNDGSATTTGTTGTTGTGCSGTGNTCNGPFSETLICSRKTITCGTYQKTSTVSTLKCNYCGAIVSVSSQGSHSKSCSSGATTPSYTPYGFVYKCSGCGMTSTSSGTHTRKETRCSTHNYTWGDSESSHTYSVSKNCSHGKSSQHSYCSHGKTSMHYPN